MCSLAEETRRLAGDFEALWLARSKPSRLCDNLELLDKAAAQATALTGT